MLVIRIGKPIEATGIVLSHGEELLFHKPHGFGIVVVEEPDQGLCVGNHYWSNKRGFFPVASGDFVATHWRALPPPLVQYEQ